MTAEWHAAPEQRRGDLYLHLTQCSRPPVLADDQSTAVLELGLTCAEGPLGAYRSADARGARLHLRLVADETVRLRLASPGTPRPVGVS